MTFTPIAYHFGSITASKLKLFPYRAVANLKHKVKKQESEKASDDADVVRRKVQMLEQQVDAKELERKDATEK